MTRFIALTVLAAVSLHAPLAAQSGSPLAADIDRATQETLPQVVAWRRDFHQHPELGNQEFRTSKIIADELRKLGYEVTTGVAKTGVVGVLKGGKPGPVVALRADMDGLPVTEQVDLPFKSTQKAQWNGEEVGVMHACGHDNHMAMALGAATILAKLRPQLPGTIKLIFQPAEEGAPDGETGGAEQMVKEQVLENPKVDAIFGLHVFPGPAGHISYRPGPLMASADSFVMTIRGKQTHGAVPWGGIDPIVIGAQIVTAAQSIVSRTVNIAESPAVVTIGMFHAGVRSNIIPDEAELAGTIRTFGEETRADVRRRFELMAKNIAEASGAIMEIRYNMGYPVTVNDPALTERMIPTLKRVAGEANVSVAPLTGTAEDFSYFQQNVPGMFFFLGVTPRDQDWTKAAQNHSPLFFADESALPVGVRALTNLAVDYLFQDSK
jgi:amidohydrolase